MADKELDIIRIDQNLFGQATLMNIRREQKSAGDHKQYYYFQGGKTYATLSACSKSSR